MTRPDWVFPEDNLTIVEPEWHEIVLGSGGNDDQEGLLFMRVEDRDIPPGEAIVGLDVQQATQIRDYLDTWIRWRETRKRDQ